MGDIGLVPERLTVAEGHGVNKIIEVLRRAARREIEIVAHGPLTNIAMALKMEPEIMGKVKRIWISKKIGGVNGKGIGSGEWGVDKKKRVSSALLCVLRG